MSGIHPLWFPESTTSALRGRSISVHGVHPLLDTVRGEALEAGLRTDDEHPEIVIAPVADVDQFLPDAGEQLAGRVSFADELAALGPEGFALCTDGDRTIALYGGPAGALYAWFAVLFRTARGLPIAEFERHEPQHDLRMLDHWDNVAVHRVMGQVERGYSGGSIFYADSRVRPDLSRVETYARAVASIGINRVAINNVNVHRREARLVTDDLDDVARIAEVFRRWGIRIHLSVSFAAPLTVGGLDTADPLDAAVQDWWMRATALVYDRIPDFGGYVVKADSEGEPGPFAYGRDHADGANMLARAVAPHGGLVHWRAFVYNHHQDWRDRSTDRARAAFDHFTPLDERFDDNVIVQVKYGPMDFQVREPISPLLSAMPHTRVALELQVTQEYTGQQQHACYLGVQWAEILAFQPFGPDGPKLTDAANGGICAVSNVGDDEFWTGHPFAQANLYAFGRLAWDERLDPLDVLDEWVTLTFGRDDVVKAAVHRILDDSWRTYESYTAPLGIGFMVTPGHHYGPSVDGYEYSPWGTYHFADRDGIGVDRTVATGTGFAGQYSEPWRSVYESLETVPDELVLFFHHVPYGHALHSGKTVIQHIYDTHFAGVEAVERMVAEWDAVADRVQDAVADRVRSRLAEQRRSATEWRDHINSYFHRRSGIPDAHGRTIY